ncbi:unnamed protein product [Didymodactylos carnosus]|uniref:Cytochrome b-c1 complex subunit 8 n=1 Tax=Didymodactylos carnosus TaxID=1234261 RepID=A0A813RNH8_9BILA|nr:unnamed protein product [Didymodactylos carnosus]CAF1248770.1 unnamed protein product [Didymodactylos carnosus]CAF3566867.1 unnamed protein product [Didymodactylos carnosus]CAF4056362.1 unnamed protein product [Didymodactylos carnosus]
MIWGKIGYQRGKIEYTLSPYQQNPYAGVGGDVSYRYYTRLFKTIAIYWLPNIAWGVALYNWANWEYERSIRKKPGEFDNEKPPEEQEDGEEATSAANEDEENSEDGDDKDTDNK